ncbi:DUF6716 putative glycosyltransferase [Streptomyces sp. NPDC048172]|uniref:DUF6716 putative glycosyltransferase n=1 Tax=Streptomyces sp. NPDC048172 TaxID=3365505 RepID=UPI00371A478E
MLADSDTRWKWGALTARRLAPGARIDGLLLRGRATPTPRQLAEVGVTVDALREVTGSEFVRTAGRGDYDLVVLACVGGAVQAMLHGLARAERRPVVVTGYVGVVYEKLSDGLLLRHGADLVLANSPYDADRFRAVYEGVGADSGAVVESVLPFLEGTLPGEPVSGAVAPGEAAGSGSGSGSGSGEGAVSGVDGPFTVVFAVQPSVPASRADRAYLLRRALGHARKHPEREVLIKLRSKPGEHTTHIEEEPYQKLVRKLPAAGSEGGLPPNCRLVYGHMGTILDQARGTGGLLVTVSSTAALESLHRGVPTAVLTDLGVREALGNHYFLGSGCLASWDQLDEGALPEADPEWVERQGAGGGGRGFRAARERVTALVARARAEDGGLPPLAPYYTLRTAPGYLPGILRRYGLGPDGIPLAGGADGAAGAAGPGVVRRALREAARGAYRHGVQRVAPVIRRVGEL